MASIRDGGKRNLLRGKSPLPPIGSSRAGQKQRGYYSDVVNEGARDELGDVHLGPRTKQSAVWKAGKSRHTPSVMTFKPPQNVSEIIQQQKHGPTTALLANSDFPQHSWEPKVQMPFKTDPGKTPRKIEIERRKRSFSKKDLITLLAERGVNSDDLIPPDKFQLRGLLNARKDHGVSTAFPPFLAIEVFDNTEYDPRTSHDWMMLRNGENGERKPVPGKALLPLLKTTSNGVKTDEKRPSSSLSLKRGTRNAGLFDRPVSVASSTAEKQEKQIEWAEVGMLDYNEEKQLYLVKRMVWPTTGGDQTGNKKGPPSPVSFVIVNRKTGCTGDNLHYWVPRVRLMFAAEDPVNFANRVEFAYRFHAKTEALIRYNFYIDCMPTDGVHELERGSLK